jgi:hypothetical protein
MKASGTLDDRAGAGLIPHRESALPGWNRHRVSRTDRPPPLPLPLAGPCSHPR